MSKEIKIELICIGDELLNGRVSDINGPFLAKFLYQKGLCLSNITICGDSLAEIQQATDIAINRSQIIFTTGGLGPTEDDRTKQSMATIFKKKLIATNEALTITKNNYIRYGKHWEEGQNHYNFVPENFKPQINYNGLAPGLIFTQDSAQGRQKLLMAPGVPREFQTMVKKVFLAELIKENLCPNQSNQQIIIKTHGVAEEKIFKQYYPNLWNDFSKFGKVCSLPQRSGVNIIISLYDNYDYQTTLTKVKGSIATTELDQYVWQYGDLSLPELIIEKCTKLNKTIAFSESCTGGLSSSKITDISGSSKVFLGGLITYENQLKIDLVNVNKSTLDKHGAVSEEVALEMALGTLNKTSSDFAISWSGIAGPTGGTEDKPIGTLALGWAVKGGHSGSLLHYSKGNRLQLKNRFSEIGLMKLLNLII